MAKTAPEALATVELARMISAIIERRGLTQAAVADVLEIDQPKVARDPIRWTV